MLFVGIRETENINHFFLLLDSFFLFASIDSESVLLINGLGSVDGFQVNPKHVFLFFVAK